MQGAKYPRLCNGEFAPLGLALRNSDCFSKNPPFKMNSSIGSPPSRNTRIRFKRACGEALASE
ncbi:MAG: hypothetical protein LBL45_08080 [Treponema sp.]|jgi:hypothetical protein|nr:hypothetical protein [Treponema sp.]